MPDKTLTRPQTIGDRFQAEIESHEKDIADFKQAIKDRKQKIRELKSALKSDTINQLVLEG